MSSTTYATQQATTAAPARPCTGLGGDSSWNVPAAVGTISHLVMGTFTAAKKRPARRLGCQPT